MASIHLQKLPELGRPIDYPACLDRIVKAAEYRVTYELQIDRLCELLREHLNKHQEPRPSFNVFFDPKVTMTERDAAIKLSCF